LSTVKEYELRAEIYVGDSARAREDLLRVWVLNSGSFFAENRFSV
jgi:hypothetical protein